MYTVYICPLLGKLEPFTSNALFSYPSIDAFCPWCSWRATRNQDTIGSSIYPKCCMLRGGQVIYNSGDASGCSEWSSPEDNCGYPIREAAKVVPPSQKSFFYSYWYLPVAYSFGELSCRNQGILEFRSSSWYSINYFPTNLTWHRYCYICCQVT